MHTTDGMSAGAFDVVFVASVAAVASLVVALLVQLLSASTKAAAIHEKVCFTGDSSDRSPGRGKTVTPE
jgi:hypothetical protein